MTQLETRTINDLMDDPAVRDAAAAVVLGLATQMSLPAAFIALDMAMMAIATYYLREIHELAPEQFDRHRDALAQFVVMGAVDAISKLTPADVLPDPNPGLAQQEQETLNAMMRLALSKKPAEC